ncbi:sirohydrochlorin cobaltochelatase [Caldalkalibacillus uzonensis]|uniref:Sirohydrochlorin cobaltochelatase n=1 Tax=Caldalkalibacillus uzonensis TaxID=353224 RepID=A0ABU0CPP7_9BACI|nr:sirohydrochlorin chelatase [Caldalkalibacillus uzonensis]MDQ0338393.1 sirohydrochlorin cobaltochelatase [Caldalkalibacillus uzonensis]
MKRLEKRRKGVLFVGHGSKDPEGNQEVATFVDMMRPQLEDYLVHHCYLEFASPTIMEGIEQCVADGATEVAVIPIILLPAGHSKLHIPHELDEARRKYPEVIFHYGRPLGQHPQTVDILLSRLKESGLGLTEEQDNAALRETAVLVVGRGSSDPDANSELYKLTRLLWEKVNVKWVETAFMGVTEPLLEEGFERCVQLGAKRVVVLPYFLFTGVLIKRMARMVERFREQHPSCQISMAPYFGYHDQLQSILLERVREAFAGEVRMNCDLCQYRLHALEHMDHHHHHHHHHHDHHHEHR